VCIQRGSLTVVSNVVVPERMPENLPAQPQQYLARSLLGVWHDSQNFVIPAFPRTGQRRSERYGIGMNFVMITSELITTQKATKSTAHARFGMPRGGLGCGTCSPEFLVAWNAGSLCEQHLQNRAEPMLMVLQASQISAEVMPVCSLAISMRFPKAMPDEVAGGLNGLSLLNSREGSRSARSGCCRC